MFTIRADNRTLTKDAQYSFLSANYASGVSSIVVINSIPFATDNYIVLEDIGSSHAEIIKISTVTGSTHTLALSTNTQFSHSESTRVTIVPYNQIKFYWTATTTFGTSDLVGFINVNPAVIHSIGNDSSHSTGYGWFVFYNSTTSSTSDNSNYVPYAGFSSDSVETLISRVYSTLNDDERKIVGEDDMLSFIQEGYDKVSDELNLVTRDLTATEEQTINVLAGTAEYALDDDFSDLIYLRTYDAVSATNTYNIDPISLIEVPRYLATNNVKTRRYLRRNGATTMLGLVPTPTENMILKYRCRNKASVLDSYSDVLALPNSAFYSVKDFAMSKAYEKINDARLSIARQDYTSGTNKMKEVSIKVDDAPDSWGFSEGETSSWA